MNNNDSNNPDKKKTLQDDDNEQLVWERLQNEAIAAQRWRLEQEIKQADKVPLVAPDSDFFGFRVGLWSNRFTVMAVASFVLISFVVVICCVW